MGKRLLIIIGLAVAATLQVAAQAGYSNLEFIENKGQWDKQVILRGELNNGSFFLQKKGFSVLLHNADDLIRLRENHRNQSINDADSKTNSLDRTKNLLAGDILHSHNYSVTFIGGSDDVEIVPDKPLPTYNNYFIGNDKSKWASNCKIYQGVTYKNVYPNIDIRYYSNDGQLKYDIIVHPGGDLKRVALRYEGPEKMSIRNNQLTIKTSVGTVKELAPYAYQASAAGKEEVICKYVIGKDSILRFDVKNYNKSTTLIVDPTLVFSTFTGSASSNWGFTATPGPDGSFFAGGIVFGPGFRVIPGAFQTNFQKGAFDIGIIKFNRTGTTRIYATYLGGNDNETPHSLICDPQGNLVVLGRTYSPDFPTLDSAGPCGGADMFVTKFNSTGTGLIGSMRIGGTADDCVNTNDQFKTKVERAEGLIRNYGDDSRSEVILDGANNIYVAASTKSKNFPIAGAPFQPLAGGGQDGVVLKINPGCNTLLFSSYLGGTGDDAAFVLKVNPLTGDIYVGGATTGAFPGNKAGALQSIYQGGPSDAFVTIISNDGTTQKKTSYFGTSGFDGIYGIEFDKKGFPYIMGSTTGSWQVTSNVGFINPGAKQFVSKLQPDLSAYVYSTTFGTAASLPNISPVAFLVDRCENVYVSGWGGWLWTSRVDPYGLAGTLGMPVTPNAIQSTTDGHDFYFIVIQKNASALLYGTFFGQLDGPNSISEHVDGGTSRYDQFGIIYQAICANCGGGSLKPFPTTPGAWSPRNGALAERGCNLAAVKIAFNFAGVSADLRSIINGRYDSSGCIPLDVTFTDTLRTAKNYIWNFGDGSPDTPTVSYQVKHTYNNVGTYRVRLIAIDSNSCNVADTVYMNIRARTDKADLAFNAIKLPPCESLTYRFDNISTSPPGKPFSDSSFIWDFGDASPRVVGGTASLSHSYLAPGTYNVRLVLVDTNYCNYPDSAQKTLRVSPLVKAQFETPPIGCAPYTAVFNNTSLAGQDFFWDFGDGTTSTDVNPVHLYNDTGVYKIKLIAVDTSTCNKIDSTTVTISVHSKPTAAFTNQPIPAEYNKPTTFFNGSSGANHFIWYFGDDDSTAKSTMDTVIHQYRSTSTYNACLVAINQFGCTDTVCHPVESLINPLLDVPNAFTPGRFGQNSTIRVQGFGIATMIFRIYNRWGQVVFETNDQNIGWDGTFKGNPQPMDVYTYTLEATYFDGKKTTKAGDITLIR
ncbi:MAG: PKD domain-containing protein [Bacteroidetes bacterium]|nr:PKD domain-containing protein [Bacteroidota bacterium]